MEEKDCSQKLISVCIAAYNDDKTIEQIIRQSADTLRQLQLNFEIIVVNDCSCDSTWEILDRLKSSLEYLTVINHKYNKGYGATIKELLYNSRGEIIFTLPGDLQIPPQAIKKMLPWINIYDIIIGLRKPRQDPLFRKINSVIYNVAVNLLFNIGTTDVNSTKLIKRDVLNDVVLVCNGPFIDAELCAKAVKKGFRIKEVAIEHRKRQFGSPSGDKLPVMWRTFKETLSMVGKI